MRDWPAFVRDRLTLAGLRPEREAEIREDLARQLEDAEREALARGAAPDAAQTIAEQHVGDWNRLAAELIRSERGRESAMAMWQQHAEDRDVRKRGGFSLLTDLRQDVLYGLRLLRKSPGFTCIAVLTLALGIGANTAIFSLIDAVMLRSLPVGDPQTLVLLKWSAKHRAKTHSSSSYGDCNSRFVDVNPSGCSFSHPFVNELQQQNAVFSSIGAFSGGGQFDITGVGPATLARAQYVSGNYFETLGVRPVVGRLLQMSDDASSAAPAIVISYGYWQRQFGGNPSIAGKSIFVNGKPFTIAGVTEPRFTNLTPGAVQDFWIPISFRPIFQAHWRPENDDAGSWWIVMVARLKPGVTPEQAQAAVTVLFRNETTHGEKPIFKPEDDPQVLAPLAQTALTGIRRTFSQPLYVLMAMVAVVLLISCSNVAGLLVSRASARQKEIAIRLAIGARRARIVRQLLTESVTLALTGAALGIMIAHWATQLLVLMMAKFAGRNTLAIDTAIDFRVLAFTCGIAVLTGVIFGLAPAFRGSRVDLTPALKAGLRNSGTVSRNSRVTAGNLLVVSQVALSVVVLVGAGLLVRTLRNLHSIDTGFETQNMLTFGIDSTLASARGVPVDHLWRDIQRQLESLPGVQSVGYSSMLLLSGSSWTTSFPKPGAAEKTDADSNVLTVGPKFFETLRVPLLQGREFTDLEYANAAKLERSGESGTVPVPAIVNETFLKTYFPNQFPIGQVFGEQTRGEGKNPGWQIVGVVRDSKYDNLRKDVQPTMYLPIGGSGVFEVRTAMNPNGLIPSIRGIAQKLDLPIFQIKTQTEQIDEVLYQERLVAQLSTVFGGLALVLASIGFYGLLSYEVTRRTQEIGIRMALGARRANVLKMVVSQGIALALIGAVVGAAAAIAVTRYLKTLLYGVNSSDPVTLAGVFALLLVVAVAACCIPAMRATRVDPLVALRYE